MEFLSDALLATVTSPWVYAVLFAVVVIDGFFPPVPSEALVVAAAAIGVSTGTPHPAVVILLAALGAALGDNIAYLLGRRIGTDRFRWMRHPRMVRAFDRAASGIRRRPAALLITARYIPIGRIAVNMTAGATRFPHRRFWPLTLLAGASWAGYSVGIGLLAGHWVRDRPLLGAAIGIVLAVTLGFAIDRVTSAISRRRAARIPQPPMRRDNSAAAAETAATSVVLSEWVSLGNVTATDAAGQPTWSLTATATDARPGVISPSSVAYPSVDTASSSVRSSR
ncbi:membrane protein DedA with SNARE-associated domain [Okibacterium sp. HSC-33S16]|nr:membrane protein DedA with SNARE-associated domain [Okibacterium sp. HSC-33S16]